MSVLATIGKKGRDGKYQNYTISISDFTNDYGQNVSMYNEQSSEERASKAPKKYVGNGKVFWTDGKVSVAESNNSEEKEEANKPKAKVSNNEDEDLPI